MRPGLWLSFGTLALSLAIGCSSRGGEKLFAGEAPTDSDDGLGGAGGDDGLDDDEQDAGDVDETPDADVEADGGDSADDDAGDGGMGEEGGGSELPAAQIACGDAICTTPGEYCCRPGANVVGPSPSCKASDSECTFGWGGFNQPGVPQKCSTHDDCAGGQCCAIREASNRPVTSIECQAKCAGAEVELCDRQNPSCGSGACRENTPIRGVWGCR